MNIDQWAGIRYQNFSGPPWRYYQDSEAPFLKLYFYSTPDQNYQITLYQEEPLPQVINLTDTLAFAQGYERWMRTCLAIEAAPFFDLTPSPTLMRNNDEAALNVKNRNRKSPALVSDLNLVGGPRGRFNYLGGIGYF